MWYPTQSIEQTEVKRQELTVHHFIYYLIYETVKINKRRSRRFTEYEAELIEKTWHPDRLVDWCFDIEDKKDFEPE